MLGLNFAKNYYRGIAIDSKHGRKNNPWAESGGKVREKRKKRGKKRKGPHLNALNERSCRHYSRDTENDCLLR